MEELADDIRRITFRLPLGIDHVHCYLLRSATGGWTLVDTGLGTRDADARWRPVLEALDAPIERIVVTHMHPDHVGGSGDVAALTGAPVYESPEDHAQCVAVWGPDRDPSVIVEHWTGHGLPADQVAAVVEDARSLAAAVRYAPDPEPLAAGDELDGWRVEHLPGHADGHLVLVRQGVLIAGDTILAGITPAIGVYPGARPDPLGDYLETLDRIERLDLRLAHTGHGPTIEDPAARAREIRSHHVERLAATEGTLEDAPKSAYDVSLALFPADLSPVLRRFALAESLAHLERLVREGRATPDGLGYRAG